MSLFIPCNTLWHKVYFDIKIALQVFLHLLSSWYIFSLSSQSTCTFYIIFSSFMLVNDGRSNLISIIPSEHVSEVPCSFFMSTINMHCIPFPVCDAPKAEICSSVKMHLLYVANHFRVLEFYRSFFS